jgi:hypothetical protein
MFKSLARSDVFHLAVSYFSWLSHRSVAGLNAGHLMTCYSTLVVLPFEGSHAAGALARFDPGVVWIGGGV